MKQRAQLKKKRRAPKYFEYRPAPLRITQDVEALQVGDFCTAPFVDLVLYDFGAVSVTYSIPLTGSLSGLIALSDKLYDNALLLTDSRRRAEHLVAGLHRAVARPCITEWVETYAIFQVEAFKTPCSPSQLYSIYSQEIAQILRAELGLLSQQEVNDATGARVSFSSDDVAMVDWNAAFLFDRDVEDVCAVLEFANVELLEMRYLDERLDDALDEAYEALGKRNWRRTWLPGSARAEMRRVAHLQVDNAVLFEGVNNALKLVGDQYLARVYRLASERFHLSEWDASILRKLTSLESIYEKMSDLAATRRLEVLEWIIIVLIAISIVLPFMTGLVGHR